MHDLLTIPATKKQKQLIHLNAQPEYIKEEFVQWATGSNDKRSCNDLTFDQANAILVQLNRKPQELDNWALFDKTNSRHRYVLSLCIQYGWSTQGDRGTIADLSQLNRWMHSNLCPVQKPLKEMEPKKELKAFIGALEGMVNKKFKK